ncbi:MAG: hypothetical protein OXK73_08020 [Rhodospirillaceae bacterium]|nr:hypothetical protein [Rhodospirillaceae bacterium]
MNIRAVLDEQLAARLREAEAAPLSNLKAVEIWDGAWDVLASPKRHSFQTPAALVSLAGLSLVHRGQQGFHPRQLQRGEALPPPTPQVRIDVAVTFVSADPSATKRASQVLGFAEAAVPVLIGAALEDIRGTNLYAKTLYEAGMSAFALFGGRTVELAPEHPEPALPETVRARGLVGAGGPKWPPPSADAGVDQAVAAGDMVTLDASASAPADPERPIICFIWRQTGGSVVDLDDNAAVMPSFMAPSPAAEETLTFEVTVIDDAGCFARDTVDVTVRP